MSGRRFSELPAISPETLAVLSAQGFERATPVQEATIPLFAGNTDVAVDAATGSGKTLAFVVPIVEKMRRLEEPLKKHQVGAVIVSPTRELARQIFTVAAPFVATLPWLRAMLLVGGTDPSADVAAFKGEGGHVLVGTPGRLDDIMTRCAFMDLRSVEALVLDEADRLLDMGFRAQVDAIMGRLPRQRRTGLFSATQTEAVESLARAGLRNPVRVAVAVTLAPGAAKDKKAGSSAGAGSGGGAGEAVQVTPSTLSISYLLLESTAKMAHLVAFLQEHAAEKVIVYFLTCACVDWAAAALARLPQAAGLPPPAALHGRMKQAAREAALAGFAAAPSGALLATDVAARGLDIPSVHWVLQFDPPQDPAAFVHRVGRTARMGREGAALVYLMPKEEPYVDLLRVRKVPLTAGAAPALAGDAAPEAVGAALRTLSEGDRVVMEAGSKAYVSYIRAYKEHHCKFIFRSCELDMGALGHAFGLLRLPGLSETKRGKGVASFVPSPVDPDTVRFKDKGREKQRLAAAAARAAAAEAAKAARLAKSKAHGGGAAGGAAASTRLPAAKRRQLEQRQDFEDLNEEYTLLKKLKKGKISQREFDAATGLSSDDEEAAAAAAAGGGADHRDLVGDALRKKERKKKKKKKKRKGQAAGGGGS